jgi:hypothetical protein
MLPKSDMFVTLRNDGPSMDERDKQWSTNMHCRGDDYLGRPNVGSPDCPSGIPNMHTIHDPMVSVS